MRLFVYLLMPILAILLVACGDETKSKEELTANSAPKQNAYEIYLENKEGSQATSDRETRLQQYRAEKARLAEAIVAEGFDITSIEHEVAEYRASLIISSYFDSVVEKKISDKQVRAYFDANPDEFIRHRARFVRASIPFGGESMPTKEQAFDLAMTIYQDFPAKETDLEKDEEHKNVYMQRLTKGVWIQLDGVEEDLRNALLPLQPGQVAKPILRKNEYLVVKLIEPLQKNVTSFEQAQDVIRFKLNNKARLEARARLLGSVE